MNFSAWSIRNPIAPILAFFMLMLLGIQSFQVLPITRFPNIDFPLIAVQVTQPGAAPAEMESQITKTIEDAVAGLNGAKNVSSTVIDGSSTTLIEFRIEVGTDRALQDTKDAIDRVRGNLPAGVDAPFVTKIDVEGQAIMTFAVSAPDMTLEEVSWFVDDTITRSLQGRSGVGRVSRYGGADREVRVELDPVKLGSFGITAGQVSQQIRLSNTNMGAGRAEIGNSEQVIRTLGDASTVESLSNRTIALPGGRHVRLADLGTVTDTYEELRSFGKLNGDQVVTFAVFRAKGASEVSVAELVNAQLDKVRADNPNVGIRLVDETVFYTYGNYESAIATLIEGSLLAVLVVLIFLRNWRATLISAIALPLSAIPTFWVMDILGFSLNLVSFLGITLATGILVDDAIVEVENIARHIRMGKTPYRAAIEAADEIGLAVIATTFTIIAVFVPVSFMGGIPGQYFMQFGLTVAIAVFFSLAVARLITPMMAAYLMKSTDGNVGHAEGENDGPLMSGYLRLVRFCTAGARIFLNPFKWVGDMFPMRWIHSDAIVPRMRAAGFWGDTLDVVRTLIRIPLFIVLFIPNVLLFIMTARRWRINDYYLTVLGAIAFLIVSVYGMLQVPGAFLPPEDVSRIAISVELPPGTPLEETDNATEAMRKRIADVDGIRDIFIINGSSPTGDRDVRRASITLLLDRLDHSFSQKIFGIAHEGRTRPQNEIEAEVFERLNGIPDVRFFKQDDRGSRELTFQVLAPDDDSLNEAVRLLEEGLAGNPYLLNVTAEGALPRPEVQIIPRMEEAARLGVTTAQIAETIRVATIGDFDGALAKLSLDNRQVPVRVRLNDETRDNLARISALKIVTQSGLQIPLSAVADVTIARGPAKVQRFNRSRMATLGADLTLGTVLGTATESVKEVIAATKLPPGVKVQESGDAEVQGELFSSFGKAMLLGILLMLAVMILLFRSVLQPVAIVMSLLFAIGGVAAALLLTGSSMSMPVLIGILMLMGIVAKNAILLVDFAVEMRAQGMDRMKAIIEAGHKRATPIVMTSIAMSAGMLPSALGVGEGGAFRSPMATAVIGGILVSTVLSLVVVPALFLMMDDLSNMLARFFARFISEKEVEPEEATALELTERLTKMELRLDGKPPEATMRAAE
jgi:multidrug efflux pump subunit AcrB